MATNDHEPSNPLPLDPAQVAKIEAIHGGFLYQHLYAVGCILLSNKFSGDSVTVEQDEDIELHASESKWYIQVKTRNRLIAKHDIKGALDRFEKIRTEHASGNRTGTGRFAIVINQEPGPELSKEIESQSLPNDVEVISPMHSNAVNDLLPPAWKGISEALEWCNKLTHELASRRIDPNALVWKLAGIAQFAASGLRSHSFTTAELPELFEQIAVQWQRFPAIPAVYRPHLKEPVASRTERIRLITGFSGSGKTSWAAESAQLSEFDSAYFDVGDLSPNAFLLALANELAAQWIGEQSGDMYKVLIPGATAVQIMRNIDDYVAKAAINALVVIDNAHRLPYDCLRALIECTAQIKITFLAQPSSTANDLQAISQIQPETLEGWDLDSVAAEVHAEGATGSPMVCERLRSITGGLPLFVRSAIKVANTEFGGKIDAVCQAIDGDSLLAMTAQESILDRIFVSLSEVEQDVLGVLSLSDVKLSREEAIQLLTSALKKTGKEIFAVLRSLSLSGLLMRSGHDDLLVHDAVRVTGRKYLDGRQDVSDIALSCLQDLLETSIAQDRKLSRLRLYVRVLAARGQSEKLVGLSIDEWFHAHGLAEEVWDTLEYACNSEALSPRQKFWGLDALVFAELSGTKTSKVSGRLAAMKKLIAQHSLGQSEMLALHIKTMLWAAKQGDQKEVRKQVLLSRQRLPDDPDLNRRCRYNIARALWSIGDHRTVEGICAQLIIEYEDVIHLTRAELDALKELSQVAEFLTQKAADQEDVKHLADCMDLCSHAMEAQKLWTGRLRERAMKLYAACGLSRFFIRVGHDLADELLRHKQFSHAKRMLTESLLPVAEKENLVEQIVELRSQLAITLAYNGEHELAESEINSLKNYLPGLRPELQQEVHRREQLIAELKRSS